MPLAAPTTASLTSNPLSRETSTNSTTGAVRPAAASFVSGMR